MTRSLLCPWFHPFGAVSAYSWPLSLSQHYFQLLYQTHCWFSKSAIKKHCFITTMVCISAGQSLPVSPFWNDEERTPLSGAVERCFISTPQVQNVQARWLSVVIFAVCSGAAFWSRHRRCEAAFVATSSLMSVLCGRALRQQNFMARLRKTLQNIMDMV